MTNQEETLKLLLERAEKGEHTEFQFLHNLLEFAGARKCYKAIATVADSLTKTATKIMSEYIANKKQNKDNLELLISYKKIKECAKFYKKDAEIVKDMIREYVYYIHYGHLVKALLGINRPEEDETDWRKLPVKWF